MNVKSIVTSWIIAILLLILVTHLGQNRNAEAPTHTPRLISPEGPIGAQQEAAQHALSLPTAKTPLGYRDLVIES